MRPMRIALIAIFFVILACALALISMLDASSSELGPRTPGVISPEFLKSSIDSLLSIMELVKDALRRPIG